MVHTTLRRLLKSWRSTNLDGGVYSLQAQAALLLHLIRH
jgi:hypothetical protein